MNDVPTSQFEAVKIAMTQDKNGHVLRLSVHPQDTPEDIMRDPVGQRYMVVIARVNDEGEPVAPPQDELGKKAVQMAAVLTNDPMFQQWLVISGYAEEADDNHAAAAMRKMLGIVSRSELKTNKEARDRLFDIRSSFEQAIRSGEMIRR